MIKTYLTAIIRVCGISLCEKINLYNKRKSVFINKSKHFSILMQQKLFSPKVLFTLIYKDTFCHMSQNFLVTYGVNGEALM